MSQNNTFSIYFKLDGDDKGLKKLSVDADGLRKIMNAAVVETEKFKSSWVNFAALATGVDSLSKTLNDLQNTLKGLTDAHAAQVEVETQLAVNMRNTMSAREKDIQSIKDLCSAQQELGVIGDEVQLSGAQELATYLTERQSLEKLISVMNDMLAQQYGLNATQENAAQIATMLGKVISGQTGALSRYGYTFDETQEKILKFGTEAQRAAVLCEVVESSVGGMNAELAKTDDGKLKQLENTIGDIKEQLGGLAQTLMPLLTIGASALIALGSIFKLAVGTKMVIAAVAGWHLQQKALTAIMLLSTGSLKKATQAVNIYRNAAIGGAASSKALGLALRGALIASGIGLALLALTAIIEYFVNSADEATDSIKELDESTKKLIDSQERAKREAEQLNDMRRQEASTLQNTRAALEINITKLKEFNGTKEQEKKLVGEMNDAYGDTMGYFTSVNDWYNALISNSEAYCQQMVLEARTRLLANRIAEKQQENHDILYDDTGKKRLYSKKRDTVTYTTGFDDVTPTRVTKEIEGSSDHEKANAALKANVAAIASMRAQLHDAAKEASQIKFSVKGNETRPDNTPKGGSGATKKTLVKDPKTKEDLDNNIKLYTEKVTGEDTEAQHAILNQIAAWKKLRDAIEMAQKQADRPAQLETLEDIDAELNYQRTLRAKVTKDNLAAVDSEIRRLEDMRATMEAAGHIKIDIENINTYDELNREISYYESQLNRVDATQRTVLQKHINKLHEVKDAWDSALKALDTPADISALDTIDKLDKAISYYRARQNNATADEIADIQKTIGALERKSTALRRGVELYSLKRDADEINALTGRDYRVKIKGMGFDELSKKIRSLQDMLNDTENPVTTSQRKDVEGLIETYEKWRKEGAMSFDTFRDGWDGIKGIGSGVESLTSVLEGNGNAWQTITGIVDGFLQIYDGISQVIEIINMMTQVTKGSAAAKIVESTNTTSSTAATIANTTALEANTVAASVNTAVKSGESIAEATASGAKLPFPANLAAIAAGVAAVVGALSMIGCFATGGIVGGASPTGDKLIARVNSGEMILNHRQQKRLFDMLNSTAPIRGVRIAAPERVQATPSLTAMRAMLQPAEVDRKIHFEIAGRKLVGVIANETRISGISGKKTNIKL